jgi:hypothetical protein
MLTKWDPIRHAHISCINILHIYEYIGLMMTPWRIETCCLRHLIIKVLFNIVNNVVFDGLLLSN